MFLMSYLFNKITHIKFHKSYDKILPFHLDPDFNLLSANSILSIS